MSDAVNIRTRRALSRLWRRLRGIVLPLAVVLSWELVTRARLVNVRLLVPPSAVWRAFLTTLHEGDLASDLLASLRRDLLGFTLGAGAGLAVGSAMGLSRGFERFFGGTFNAAKQVAVFAWLPLMSVWLGTEEPAKVAFVALAAFYPVVVNTFQGIRSVDRLHLQVASVFRFSSWQLFRKVVLPGALPSIFAGLHLSLIYAWLGTLGSEYLLAAAPGIGNLMVDGREQFAMDKVLLGVILTGLVGYALNVFATAIEHRLLGWHTREA
jgi:sulfonate transport system permease protein